MENSNTIIWNDQSAETLFADFSVDDFMTFEKEISSDKKNSSGIETAIMREHADKSTGMINRRVTRIEIGGRRFFLKKAEGSSFEGIKNEFDAINLLPKFDLLSAPIAAYMLDPTEKKGFLLLKNLDGFYSIQELVTGRAPQDAVDDFIERKEELLSMVIAKMNKVHSAKYSYPDLFAKHVYIKKGSDDIVFIDLDRFRPLNKCPWYFGFPISSLFVRAKCWRKFKRSLRSESLPDELLNRLLKKAI